MSQKVLKELARQWHDRLLESPAIVEQLHERFGITPRCINELTLGLVSLPRRAALSEKEYRGLSSFGIMKEKYAGSVAVPLWRRTGQLVNMLFLNLENGDNNILRTGGLINLRAFTAFKGLVIVDTKEDFFSYYTLVKENVVPVIQSARMHDDFVDALKHSRVEEVVFMNDSPYWQYLTPRLAGTDCRVFEISLPDNTPARAYLKEHSPQKLIAYLEGEKAKEVKARRGETLPDGSEGDTSEEEKKEYLTMTEDVGELVFEDEDRRYRLRGFNRDGFEKIVQLVLEMDGRPFPDKLDLSRSQSRHRFSNSAGAEFEASPEIIRHDLAFIYKKLDALQDERFREKAGLREKNIYVARKDGITKAVDRLMSRDLLTEILPRDTERLGYVEEGVNKKLFYLASISRMTGEPLSVLDISPPGTGKSFGMSSIMALSPPDEVIAVSRLTPQALYYESEKKLQGKVLHIEEIVGMEESLESIRMILSAGVLSVLVTEKDPRTGILQTVRRRIEANLPIVSTGVRDIFDDETLSRFILTYNDATETHIKRVMRAQGHYYSLEGGKAAVNRGHILKRHWDYQSSFDRTLKVVNPYHGRITLNHRLPVVTRKNQQYLRLMHNIAFTRQHGREKKKDVDRHGNEIVYIEVRPEDIETANEIALYVFRFVGGDLSKRLHDAFGLIVTYCLRVVKEKRISLHEYRFSRREIREQYGWDEATARRLLNELESLEYLRKVRGHKQGMRYQYTIIPFDGKETGDLRLLDPGDL